MTAQQVWWCCLVSVQDGEPLNIVDEVIRGRKRKKKASDEQIDGDVHNLIARVSSCCVGAGVDSIGLDSAAVYASADQMRRQQARVLLQDMQVVVCTRWAAAWYVACCAAVHMVCMLLVLWGLLLLYCCRCVRAPRRTWR
jgi:hypothetical protein